MIVYCFVAEAVPDSAFTVKIYVPVVEGVPVIVPVAALSESPAGRVPELTDQVTPEVLAVSMSV